MSQAAPTTPAEARRVPADTVERQRRASHPETSAWVSANAGSGKTHVLAQRVLRLLLAGVAPARILCLTFTKAAAANMSIRVFDDLARWTRLDDAALRTAIADTGAPAPAASGTELDAARRLFARTVETPGGLKIQTIHAFCERLLHLFPFEANVPARFEVLDDHRAADLMLRARELVLTEALREPASTPGRGLAALTGQLSATTFAALIAEALGHRGAVRRSMRDAGDFARLQAASRTALGLGPDETPAAVEAEMAEGGVRWSDWGDIARRIGADGGGPGKTGNRLAAAAEAPDGRRTAPYLDVFLTAAGEARADAYLSPSLRKREPALCDTLDAERARLLALVARRKAAETAERTAALIAVASAILDRYDTAKRRRGLLDFEDLIERTRNLLETSRAAWVLYKLDRGIDHILIDEAQDTSPEQWQILRAISDEFFSGLGRSPQNRTFFAVGDEKQSIYSFQGARPAMFDEMHRYFERRARDAERRFEGVDLLLSFRSARAVLDTVDRVFAHGANGRGLAHDRAGPQKHEPLKTTPGLVEIWPAVTAVPHAEPGDWRLPVDVVEASEPPVVVAGRIADRIARMTAPGSGETVEDNDTRQRRPVRAGDVLILVRSRNSVFEALIRACKERGVPVAGADRLALTQHIAVMDLVAAGRAALSPDDDFTLACVLKSPLVGLDDDDLIALAPGRPGTLAAALRTSSDPRHADAHAVIAGWRDRSAWLTPFGFYTRMLGADGGRRNLLGRLGPEAGDAIDEFLALTLAHERDGAPSLMAFLARLDGTDLSIKRDMEAAGDAVRVMTVHAAKGLEAKIVFLPDTCAVPSGRHDPSLFALDGAAGESGLVAWSPRAEADPTRVAAARALSRQRAVEEHNRLLYVAMTRAEERLYIAGFCGEKGPSDGCWYAMIAAAGLPLAPAPAPWDPGAGEPAESVLRLEDPAPAGAGAGAFASSPAAASGGTEGIALPDWLHRAPPADAEPEAPPVRPSNPLGAADQAGPAGWPYVDRRRTAGRRRAAAAGRLLHRLLQHLPDIPAERRAGAAARFLAAQGAPLGDDHRAALAAQALAVLADPVLAPLFGPESRAEVAVTASIVLPSGRAVDVTGQIDRIGVAADAVHIADFKTGAPGEVTPKQVLQLALYRAAVAPLYPGRMLRTHLVWTATAEVIEVSEDECRAALETMG
jgi:ATP-dependent helicase/nuclease subunit A